MNLHRKVLWKPRAGTRNAVLEIADALMYEVRETGRNRILQRVRDGES